MNTIKLMRLRIPCRLNNDQLMYTKHICKVYGFVLHHWKDRYWISR